MMSMLFGGKDPFFTYSFDGIFRTQTDPVHQSKEITIEELGADGNPVSPLESSKELAVKNSDGKKAETNLNGQKASGSKSFSFQRVAYGGINGMYYTGSVTRKTGDDGVVFMEINEEDKTVGEAFDTVSRGIHDKGHSVTTKRTPAGKVDTVQTLHNLNEDELPRFEETWRSNSQALPPDWKSGFNLLEDGGLSDKEWSWWPTWGGWALPPAEYTGGDVVPTEPSERRTKKVVRVNVE